METKLVLSYFVILGVVSNGRVIGMTIARAGHPNSKKKSVSPKTMMMVYSGFASKTFNNTSKGSKFARYITIINTVTANLHIQKTPTHSWNSKYQKAESIQSQYPKKTKDATVAIPTTITHLLD